MHINNGLGKGFLKRWKRAKFFLKKVLTLEKEYHIKRFTDRIAQGRESLRAFCGKKSGRI